MAYLVVEYSGTRALFPIKKELISVGQIKECDLILSDEDAANIHCHISREDDGTYRLLSLAHYTLLSGKEARKEKLKDGDVMTIGRTTLTFKEGEPPEEESSRQAQPEEEGLSLKPEAVPREEEKPLSTCESCGREFPGAEKLCPSCRQAPAEKEMPPQEEGSWSVLGEEEESRMGVPFEEILSMVRAGQIGRYTTVKGPPTKFEWKYASETPRLCRYLNICHNCGARVDTQQVFCHICGTDLDGLGRKRRGMEEKVEVERKRSYRKVLFVIFVCMAAVCIVAFVFTSGLWRRIAPRNVESYLDGLRERAAQSIKAYLGPEKFAAEREKIKSAERLVESGRLDEARAVYEEIIKTYPESKLARDAREGLAALIVREARGFEEKNAFSKAESLYQEVVNTYPETSAAEEARQGLERVKDERAAMSIKSMMGVADSLFELGKYEDALEKYREIKEKYPDHPSTKDIDEKIRNAEAMTAH